MSRRGDLALAFRAASPRHQPGRAPLRSWAIHGAVALAFLLLLVRGCAGGAVWAWALGLAYVLYDTALLAFTVWQSRPHPSAPSIRPGIAPSLAVVIAARNEAAALPLTLDALRRQTLAPAEILLADDGSTDATAAWMAEAWGLAPPPEGMPSAPSPVWPALRWLRLAPGGKAAALNQAVLAARAEVLVTVDADTVLRPGALEALAGGFADPALVAASGVLEPVCGPGRLARLLERFQAYEYVRNALSRAAFARADALLLIPGALGAYRREAVLAVGGFDEDCLVEDYELVHRLRRHGAMHGLGWRTEVLPQALGRTDAPATLAAFFRQRRRWFGGFLQTQFWYRAMVGDARFGRVGTLMLPIKAIDALQPVYGLTAVALLVAFVASGRWRALGFASGIVLGKLALDLCFHAWSALRYRRWAGQGSRVHPAGALAAALAEPFSFQLLRHVSAAAGWLLFLRGGWSWSPQVRHGVASLAGSDVPAPR